jgi:hypothetical protein
MAAANRVPRVAVEAVWAAVRKHIHEYPLSFGFTREPGVSNIANFRKRYHLDLTKCPPVVRIQTRRIETNSPSNRVSIENHMNGNSMKR